MSILVIASHDNKVLAKSTLQVVSAASLIGGDIHLLLAGSPLASLAEEASHSEGVSKILVADDAIYQHQLPENLALLVASLASTYTHILTAADSVGKDFLPRVAALLDVTQISEIIEVLSPDSFKRTIYAGNAIETVVSQEPIKIMTVRSIAFAAAGKGAGKASIEAISALPAFTQSEFISSEAVSRDRVELTGANIVVSGGRGLGSKEQFVLIEKLAKKLGAAIGASRAAVDAGYVANDMQVGQTGKIVAPSLYIAIGISGAIQHLAGMKDSKVIVAINKDENAPIFSIADYGLVGDLFQIVPELIEML